ncbi:hypothetical protein FRC05_007074 [Tulasnella sp. 425]|nr:hypothetical protein FRC05_007074 [Tulasnella sp. 425]
MGSCLSSSKSPKAPRAGSKSSSKAKEQKSTSKKDKGEGRSVRQSPQNNTPINAPGPSEQLDYTGRVTAKNPPDTSHKLVNSYAGEVKGGKDKGRVTVKALRIIGNGKNDPNFKKWTTAVDQRLRRELGGWKRIKGPFVEYIGFATVDGVPAVLTQFVEGTSAKEASAKKNAQDKRRLVLEFADALRTLHREQLLHGNIEPRHFIVDKKGKGKLGGFCFNQMIEDELKKINPSEEYRRSARYTPPEILENKPANGKSDVYSFACVAVELMTGKLPFSTIPQEAAVTQLAINGETHLSRNYAELENDPWWPTLKLCWSKNVEARPSMENLYEKLSGTPKK